MLVGHRAKNGVMKTKLLACLAATALCACAQVNVRSLGTAAGQPQAFELRSRTLVQLKAEATRLCPTGYQVLRQWHSTQRAELEDNMLLKRVAQAQDFIGAGDAVQAQATIQCKS